MEMIGVIGGSGLYNLPGFTLKRSLKVDTPYGEPSDEYILGEIDGIEVAFLPRHSSRHNIPPHRVNYRANIWGFKELGVDRIIAVNAVGGINRLLTPGTIVVADQVIDFTHNRQTTFYDGPEVVHIDFTEPFCPEMREVLTKLSEERGLGLLKRGTYICTEGPRLESRAEIEMFRTMGADMVGMTAMPEACLARELQICYLLLAVVTNYAAGITSKPLTTTEVIETMGACTERIKQILSIYIPLLKGPRGCSCKEALKEATL